MSGRGHPALSAPCPRCTGLGDAHYLTCPVLRRPVPVPRLLAEDREALAVWLTAALDEEAPVPP